MSLASVQSFFPSSLEITHAENNARGWLHGSLLGDHFLKIVFEGILRFGPIVGRILKFRNWKMAEPLHGTSVLQWLHVGMIW